jgi:hypothetical protein
MKKLKMREVIWNDVYTAAEILKPLKANLNGVDIENDNAVVSGIMIFKNMIAEIGDAKKEMDEFLGSLFDITGEEFNKLPLMIAANCIKQFKKQEGFEDFFDLVKDSMK